MQGSAWIPALAATALLACGARTELDQEPAAEAPGGSGGGSGVNLPTAICPGDIVTTPLTPVQLVGSATDDGHIISYLWELLDQPLGSSCLPPTPSFSPIATFTPDLAGSYPIRFTVRDDEGNRDDCQLTVQAVVNETFRVEMFWNPPEDPSDNSDVDLHLLHPGSPAWFSYTGDCYYANCSAAGSMSLDWDAPGYLPDNPSLDIDDVDGFGPENINIVEPIVGQRYAVGVHYFDPQDWYPPATVFIRIYCGMGSVDPVWEQGPVPLSGSSDIYGNDFWKVAHLTWNGSTCNVEPIGSIVTAYEAQQAP